MIQEAIRVLIVDDIPQVRQGLKILLGLVTRNLRPGIEVIGEARDGREAVEQARSLQPDVVLMDLEMPILDGYEATRKIKADLPTTRVIILSIHAGPGEQELAYAVGADGFVVKGSGYQVLLDSILPKFPPPGSNHQKNGERQ